MTSTSSRQQRHSTKTMEKWKQGRKLSSSVTSAESSVGSSSRSRHRSSNFNNYERHRPPKIVTSSAGASPKSAAAAVAVATAASPTQRRHTNNNNNNNGAVLHACDDKGRCIFHPHIQLRKKAIMGVLGGWKDIRRSCPDCERQEFMQELMAREANEIQQMERILNQMEQLSVVESLTSSCKDDGLKVSSGDVSSRSSKDSKERNSSQATLEGARRQQSQQLERRSRKQLNQPSSSPKKAAAAQRRSRRQRTLSPKKDRKSMKELRRKSRTLSPKDRKSIKELRRQRTLSPKDRKSVKELRRQRTLSPKDRKSVRELRRQRTLSPKDRKSVRELRRQRTLSPKDRTNGNRELRRQRTLSPRKDRGSDRELRRRQRTLSPIKDRNGSRQLRRQRTLSPVKDRTKLLRRQRTLSPINDRNSNKELRRQGTFPPKKAVSSPSSSTKRDESDNSDEDSSSSSFQRQQLRKWAMWKRMAEKIEMEAIDAHKSTTRPRSRSDVSGNSSDKEAGNTSSRADKVKMKSIDANEDNEDTACPSSDASGDSFNAEYTSSCADKAKMESIDALEDNEDTTSPGSDASADSSNKAGGNTSTRADKLKMDSLRANEDNEDRTCPSSDVSGDSSNRAENIPRTSTNRSIRRHQTCPLHPTVRMRSNKCSVCCALEKTLELRKAKKEVGCGVAVVKSDADGASSVGDDDDDADEDDVSLSDDDSSNDGSIDIEKFRDDDSCGSKQLMVGKNEEISTADSTPVSLFNEGSTDLTAAKLSVSDVDECGGDVQKSKASIKLSNVTVEAWTEVEDVHSDSDEDDDGPSTTVVQQGSQSEALGTAKYEKGEGNDDRPESDDATGALSALTSGRRETKNDKSTNSKSSVQAQSSAVERQPTISLPSETVTTTSDRSETVTLDSTPASHENSNDAHPEESHAIPASSAESEANTSNKVQHQLSEVDAAKRKPSSNQRLSRSTVRRDVINKRRSHSKSLDGESTIPFFAALVENARSRSQSVTRNLGGQGRKKLWARSRSRSRSARQDGGSAHTKEETLASNLSGSRSFSLSRSFTKKVGKDTGNNMSNIATNVEKNADENRSRRRKGKAGKTSSSGTESALKKTMISSPEKTTEFLHLTANHREPITHPSYKLGDVARDEDMIIFPTKSRSSSRRGRHRLVQDSSQSTCSADEEQDRLIDSKFIASVKELHHLDAAFIRRSNGRWTYAIVANIDDKGIIFVVDKKGSTKTLTYDTSKWKNTVRRIKVLAHGRAS